MLKSNLCHFSDAYIVVKGTVTVANSNNDAYDKRLVLKNNAPFTSLIHSAEDLHFVMPMYDLPKQENYSKTTGRFRNYYRDETNSGVGGENNNINYSIKDS